MSPGGMQATQEEDTQDDDAGGQHERIEGMTDPGIAFKQLVDECPGGF